MKKLLLSFVISIIFSNIYAQQCSLLDAGDDVTVNCLNNCTTLEASFMPGFNIPSATYTISNTTPCPLPPVTGGTPTSIHTDDEWSGVITLPFDFVYFNQPYNQLIIGDNGVVSFDINRTTPENQRPNSFCRWSMSATDVLPNANLFRNTIYGAWHDLLITAGGTIEYYVSGTAPQRIFVINFNSVGHFSCTQMRTTQRILLYETTNVIDIQITRKDICHGWNGGLATIGIQNQDGTVAYVPTGRNTSVWGVNNEELWRFSPGTPASAIYPHTTTWFDNTTGVQVGTGDSLNVCVTADTTYRCQLDFVAPDGTPYTLNDTVTVFFDDTHDNVDLGPDLSVCDNITTTLDGTVANATAYQWSENGVPISGATNATLDITHAGTYSVEVSIGVCSTTDEIIITTEPTPIVDVGADFHTCSGNTETLTANVSNLSGSETYQWSKDGTAISGATSATLDVTETGTYEVSVTNTIGCVGSDEIVVTFDPYPDLELGDDQTVCPYDTATITSNIIDADTYTWEINGVTDANTTDTLTINGTGSYDVVLTIIRGTCTVSDSVHIEILTPVTVVSTPIFYGELDIVASGGLPAYQYSLDGVNYQSSNHFSNLPDADYVVYVKDSNGCIYDFPPVHVTNLIFPHFFTPNGDGYNDTWRIEKAENTPDASISIYDRYGKTLKIMHTGLDEYWNGTFNNKPLPADDYWFSLILKTGKIYKGHFSLKR
jgi:gliding motility-associated-like protein